jgi:hypothetical protein
VTVQNFFQSRDALQTARQNTASVSRRLLQQQGYQMTEHNLFSFFAMTTSNFLQKGYRLHPDVSPDPFEPHESSQVQLNKLMSLVINLCRFRGP